MGTAFQIQDDILNLVADENKYGKETSGDITEGKRTLILIHLLNNCPRKERAIIKNFLEDTHSTDNKGISGIILELMHKHGSIDYARKTSKYMAGAALREFYFIFSLLPASRDKKLIEEIILYMINHDY